MNVLFSNMKRTLSESFISMLRHIHTANGRNNSLASPGGSIAPNLRRAPTSKPNNASATGTENGPKFNMLSPVNPYTRDDQKYPGI